MSWRLPSTSEHTVVCGRNGSGKTRLATFLLSHSAYDRMPWVIVDYKGEELFDGIDHLHDISFGTVPKEPGLYRLQPLVTEADAMEEWMWKVHARGKVGLYFDETLQVPNHYKPGSFRAILTQGRSKRIPTILNTQRPSGVSPYIFSEAHHFAVFSLNRDADIQRIEENTGNRLRLGDRLPPYYSRWYDVNADQDYTLEPVEGDDKILERFNRRLKPKSRFL